MLSSLPLWLHIVGATIWVGSQIMMFVVVVPAIRLVDNSRSRGLVLSALTKRFGYLGFFALALLIVTGLDNIDRYAPASMFDYRYGYILAVKLTMVASILVMTGAHAVVIGPRLLAAQTTVSESADARSRLHRLRFQSISISVLTLLLSLGILFCAALLQSSFAYAAA